MTPTERQLVGMLAKRDREERPLPEHPNPLNDDDFDGNDDQIDALKDALRVYASLHDMVSELVEDGDSRLQDALTPEEYDALVAKLVECVNLHVTDPTD